MAGSQLSESELSKDCRFLFSEDTQESSSPIMIGHWRISRIRLLSILCALLAFLCVVLIIVSSCAHISKTSARRSPEYHKCNGVNCLRQAAEIVSYMNKTISPCTNFYRFACDNFDQIHPSGDFLLNTVQSTLEELNARRIEDMLTSKRLRRIDSKSRDSALRKVRVFFQTCVNSLDDINSLQPFLYVFKNLGGWNVLNSEVQGKNMSDLQNLFEKSRELHGLRLFFTISWLQRNRSVVIESPVNDFITSNIFFNIHHQNERMNKRQKLIEETLVILQKAASFNSSSCNDTCSAKNIAKNIINFEVNLAKLASIRNNNSGHNKIVTLQELNTVFPFIRWPQLIYLLFGNGIDLNNLTIVLEDIEFLQRLDTLLNQTNTTTLVNYVYWKVIEEYLPALGPRFSVISQELQAVTSAKVPKSRKNLCYFLLKKHMSRALRGLFIIDHIGVSNFGSVLELFKLIQNQVAETFDWMTPEPRKSSLQILSNLSHDFGHAAWVSDEKQLDEYYKDLHIQSSSFFENLVEANSFRSKEVKRQLALLINDNEDDDQLWVTGKSEESDIGYDPIQERLIIRPGALQVPLFVSEPGFDLTYMNVAALGSLIFAELAKPFFIYHYTVRTESWWDELTESRYENYKQCLNRSLQGYTLEVAHPFPIPFLSDVEARLGNFSSKPKLKMPFNPERVMSYVQSQHLSLILSRALHSKIVDRTQKMVRLAGVEDFTIDQMFYIMFAQTRCQSTHMQLNHFLYTALRRFPIELMINNFFYNDPEFVAAFQCSDTPQQHKKEQCSIG